MNQNNQLTDEAIDSIVEAASEADTGNMEKIKETVEIDTEAPLESGAATVDDDGLIECTNDYDLDVDLFDAADPDKVVELTEEKKIESAKSNLDLSDSEAMEFIKIANELSQNPDIKIYSRLPKKVQDTINKMMLEAKIPVSNRESVSKFIVSEFLGSAEVEAAFVDLEKALAETVKVPSIVDMYGEHTHEAMGKNIDEMIEKLKEEDPEKAEMLRNVQTAYNDSISYDRLKNEYNASSYVRKAVRRHDNELKRVLEMFNRKNMPTRFKMYDIFEIMPALNKVFFDDVSEEANGNRMFGMEISEVSMRIISMLISKDDIEKFCVLLATSCESMDANDIVSASYMYYLTKNIIMLKHTQLSKSTFAVELINNICDVIAFIRDKEAEFYAANPHLDKSKSSKKSNSTRRGGKRN